MAAEALSIGWRYQQAGDFTRAEQTCRESLDIDDSCAELWHLLGAVRRSLGELPDAVECFRRAVSLKPDYSEARNFLAVSLIEAGRLEEGIAELRRAIALRPSDAELRFNLGLALKKQGRAADAIAAWRIVLELKPDHAGARRGLQEAGAGATQVSQSKRGAGRSFSQPADPARVELATVLNDAWRAHTSGDLKAAESGYYRALEIDGTQHDVWYLLGAVAQAAGRLNEAVKSFRRALDLKPDYADAHNYLAVTLLFGTNDAGLP
jgi:protein O-GlcNAc transferase